ncbi:hypothetical protein [Nocardia sp. NPDC004123]
MRAQSPDLPTARRRPPGTRRAAAVAVLASAGLMGGSLTAAHAATQQLSGAAPTADGLPAAKAVATTPDGPCPARLPDASDR